MKKPFYRLTNALGWLFCEAAFQLWAIQSDRWIENTFFDRFGSLLYRIGCWFYSAENVFTMKINRKGCTRIVFEHHLVVFKVPNVFNGWAMFLRGLLSNINEHETYRAAQKYHKRTAHLLCPIIWASWGGWLLIMRKAETSQFTGEDGKAIDYSQWIVAGYGGDDKPENYGTLNGRTVKIDYA